jgi:hypothetical protein
MMRWLALVLGILATVWTAATAANDTADPCRPAYVVPYSEQCDFEHHGITTDASPKNVAAAYAACDRAQTEAGNCLSSKVRQLHIVALSVLYRAVSEQADIAMFAGQYKTAEALLREQLEVLDIVAREAKPGDAAVAMHRAQTESDLAASIAGACRESAYVAGLPAREFAHDRRYKDLEKLLVDQWARYESCARLAPSPRQKAYVEYIGLVALEESGRAAQAAQDNANAVKLFTACLSGSTRVSRYAAGSTKQYLALVTALCHGRMSGKYRVDQPQPLDREAERFTPLALPSP